MLLRDFSSIVRYSIHNSFTYLLILALSLGSWGCAILKNIPNPFKESDYKKVMEQQQQKQKALVAAEEEVPKKILQMTATGCEEMGDNYLRQGDLDRAFIQYGKALDLEPANAGIRYKVGSLFLKRGLPEEAIKEFQQILKDDLNNSLAYEGMGKSFFKQGNFDESEKYFRQSINLNSGSWQAHNFLGIIYDRQRKFEAAIPEYTAAIAIKPNEAILFNNLGMAYYLNGKYEKAANAFAEAVKIDGTNSKINNNLALALSKLGRFQEAFEAFKRGRDEATAYNNIGYLYLTAGRYDEAIKSFEKAIEINPKFYVRAHENMKEAKATADVKSQGKNIEPEDIPQQVPQSGTIKKDVPEPESKEPFQKSCPNCHIVEAGETLSSIAKKYNMTVENLEKLNGISSEKILRVGTKLRLF